HGLSYTTFEYTKIQTDRSKAKDTEQVRVDVTVKNTGKVAGKEVVQLYVSPAEGVFPQPEKALRKFVKVELQPGEQKTVSFELGFRDFANYDPRVHAWQVT
ncbi:MAG: fibronectin type III-like domain-contianing protein, partial [Saprospiraceae bacterium]|nr:fibronectin type III-like domain-contianing protein [Saprospiraceae bacterium]